MRVYGGNRNFANFAAFAGKWEDHCNSVYADCPDLLGKCLACPLPGPFGSCISPAPYTDVGKAIRGLPSSYQPGTCGQAQSNILTQIINTVTGGGQPPPQQQAPPAPPLLAPPAAENGMSFLSNPLVLGGLGLGALVLFTRKKR